jgi:hypothetical protein
MKVVLLVHDENGIEIQWELQTTRVDDALTAIDMALEACDYEIVGIQRVESAKEHDAEDA